MTFSRCAHLAAALGLAALLGGCAPRPGAAGTGRKRIVATYPVLAAVVADLAGDAFEVRSAMPNGVDVHAWEPSARDIEALTRAALARHAPRMVLLSVPFPGSVYAAFRIAQTIKAHDKSIITVLGGGFVNTELRELSEPRVFDFFDYVN